MGDWLLLLLFVVNAPLYALVGHCCFGSTRAFLGALRASVRLDVPAGPDDLDGRATLRLVVWAALCAVLVFSEHRALSG